MPNKEPIPSVTTRQEALSHLAEQGVDTDELDSDEAIVIAAQDAGFMYPRWRDDLFRIIQDGEADTGRTLQVVDSVSSKSDAIDHLREQGVPVERLEDMEDPQARATVDFIAGQEGFVYPNYRPL